MHCENNVSDRTSQLTNVYIQETEAKNDCQNNFLFLRDLKIEDDLDWQGVCQNIRDDVECGVAKIEEVDVDTFSGSSGSPSLANGLALECCNKYKGGSLCHNHSHHDPRETGEVAISESGVEP